MATTRKGGKGSDAIIKVGGIHLGMSKELEEHLLNVDFTDSRPHPIPKDLEKYLPKNPWEAKVEFPTISFQKGQIWNTVFIVGKKKYKGLHRIKNVNPKTGEVFFVPASKTRKGK